MKDTQSELTIQLKEQVEKTLAIKEEQIISLIDIKHLDRSRCFYEGCEEKPYYTIGALLPSIWFDRTEKPRLIPVTYVACVKHRFDIIENLPKETVSVIVRDISKEAYELLSEMLKQALSKKGQDYAVYISR